MIRIGILGCGHIAQKMARTLRMMKENGEEVCLYAAAARQLQRAEAFCAAEGFEKAYGSYEELAGDPLVDLVYIATPHSHHYRQMMLCVENGRNVLCEKAFTLNAAQARHVLSAAKAKGVLVAEAIWTRYMPSRRIIDDLIAGGTLGRVQFVSADLHYPSEQVPRIWDPALAGGALLDLGVYCINFACMALGSQFERMETNVQMLPTGVDRQESITFYYENGAMAQLTAGVAVRGHRRATVCGDKGFVCAENVNNPEQLTLYTSDDNFTAPQDVPLPKQLTGYEYQVRACMQAIRNGWTECPEMPHSEIIRVMEIMDQLRSRWGMRYPQEKTIHLAGGCYWGVEKYLSNIPGVIETEVGFANGSTHHPTYQQVRYENTGHAETVRVVYDESILPLDKLLRLFWRIIDPVSVNRQGEDEGVQYRTGVYVTDPESEQTARRELERLAQQYDQPLAVEVAQLAHFYSAEEYHQKYLDKNPAGYCHVPWSAINDVKKVDISQV